MAVAVVHVSCVIFGRLCDGWVGCPFHFWTLGLWQPLAVIADVLLRRVSYRHSS
jgi:hypothetical protein